VDQVDQESARFWPMDTLGSLIAKRAGSARRDFCAFCDVQNDEVNTMASSNSREQIRNTLFFSVPDFKAYGKKITLRNIRRVYFTQCELSQRRLQCRRRLKSSRNPFLPQALGGHDQPSKVGTLINPATSLEPSGYFI